MLAAIAVSTILVLATIFLHFFVLRGLASRINDPRLVMKRPLVVVVAVLFSVHVAEVLIFGSGYLLLDAAGQGYLSAPNSEMHLGFYEIFYFSIASYTTLGMGDIVPHGAARLVAGVEALAGLLLIAWSASFTYLMMERLWTVSERPS